MKTRTIVFETELNVGDRVLAIVNGSIYRGTVMEIYMSMDQVVLDSCYSVPEKSMKPAISYKIEVRSCGFCTTHVVPESAIASSIENIHIFGD